MWATRSVVQALWAIAAAEPLAPSKVAQRLSTACHVHGSPTAVAKLSSHDASDIISSNFAFAPTAQPCHFGMPISWGLA